MAWLASTQIGISQVCSVRVLGKGLAPQNRACKEMHRTCVCVWVIARAFNITGTQWARVFEKEVALFEPLFLWSSCFGPCFSKSTSKYVQLKSHKVHGVQMFQEQPLHCHSALLSTSWIDTFFMPREDFLIFPVNLPSCADWTVWPNDLR